MRGVGKFLSKVTVGGIVMTLLIIAATIISYPTIQNSLP